MGFIRYIAHEYNELLSAGDPSIQHWPLVYSPIPLGILVLSYIAIVVVGPRAMRNRKPMQLRWILFVYNLGVAILSLYILILTVSAATAMRYSWSCQPLESITTPKHSQLASAIWFYYIMKFLEFCDTLFLILRKKNGQLSLLHVYHHSTITIFSWLMIKLYPGGISHTMVTCNSTVHVVMYTYYSLSALGPSVQKYLWWKKYLTQFQMMQFFAGISIVLAGWYKNCDYPAYTRTVVLPYLTTFVVLFGHFYLQTYILKRTPGDSKKLGLARNHEPTTETFIQRSNNTLNGTVKQKPHLTAFEDKLK